VQIGYSAVVAAYSVVAKCVAPYTVVGGNPARFIKDRFDEELKDVLLRLRWWDKTREELLEIIPLLCECDLEKAKTELKKFL